MALSERLQFLLSVDSKQAVKGFQDVGKTADKELGKVDGKLDRVGAGLTKFGAGAVAFAGVAGAAMFKAAGEASNLEESINAVNVTFGDAAGGILQLGEEAATSVGLAKSEFNGLAVQFSNFAKEVAGPGGDVVQTIDDLTTRAADFASVMNLDVAEAARVFQSGLAGETEPLKKFGINLSAVKVEAFAYANGIAEVGAQLTESQKVQARYGLLMEQTAQMHGDFANTADGAANSQRIMKAELKNLTAEIGAGALPVMTKLVGVVRTGIERFNALNEATGGNLGTIATWGTIAVGAAGAFSLIVGQLIKMRTAFVALRAVMVGHPLLTIATVVGAAVVAFGLFGTAVDNSSTSVDNLAQSMRDAESPLEGLVNTVNSLADEGDVLREVMLAAGVSTHDLAKAAQAGGDEWKTMRDRLDDAARSMDLGVIKAGEVKAAIGDLADNAARAAEKNEEWRQVQVGTTGVLWQSVRAIEGASGATDDAAESTEALTESLAKQDEARAANHKATVEVTEALEEEAAQNLIAAEAARDQTKATEHAVTVLGRAKKAHEDAAKAAEENADKIDAVYEASLRLVGGDIAVRNAQREAAAAMEELTDNAIEQSEEVDNATEAQLRAVEATANHRIEMAEASGETLTAKEKSAIYREELVNLVDQLDGPVKSALLRYVAELDAIPRSIDVFVNTNYRDIFHSEVNRDAARARNAGSTNRTSGGSVARGDDGGVVPGPKGQPTLIVAEGGEVVVPTHKLPGGPVDPNALGGGGGPLDLSDDTIRKLAQVMMAGANGAIANHDAALANQLRQGRRG